MNKVKIFENKTINVKVGIENGNGHTERRKLSAITQYSSFVNNSDLKINYVHISSDESKVVLTYVDNCKGYTNNCLCSRCCMLTEYESLREDKINGVQ